MNTVTKTELSIALNILLTALNQTSEGQSEAEKTIADIEKVTGLVIHDVCNLYMEADLICKRHDMDFEQVDMALAFANKIVESDYDFDDVFSTLMKVNALDAKYGDLNDIEHTLVQCKESAEWWAEHGDNADEMVDIYNTCNRFDFDDSQIVEIGRFFRNNDYNDLAEAYEVMDAMEGHDADDAAKIMQLIQESDITHDEAMDAIRFYEKHRVMIARYEAIAAIVSPEPNQWQEIKDRADNMSDEISGD